VPLLHGEDVIGVAHMGSRTAFEFSREDKLLFRAMASRATVLLVQGRLVERERAAREALEEGRRRLRSLVPRRGEAEGLAREARQAEALALLDALLAGAPAGVALLDTRLRYVRVNEVLAAANGQPMAAHLGRTVREVLGEARGGVVEPLLRRVLETGEPVRSFEFTGPTALEPHVPHEWMGDFFPVRASDGELLGVAGIIVDITAHKRREEELSRTAEFRERFLGIVSHDLRNPLNAILLSANALLRAEDVPERHLKPIRRLVTSAERMERMIGDLLDFTRGRLGGGLPITPRPMNLKLLCRQVLEELEVAYPERMLRLVGEGDFAGEWDPDRIAQLLGNLGKNALDYSPERTPVDLVLCDEGATVHLTLRNRGAPIRADLLPHLFEPFRRGEQAEQRSGLGLGLFIARQVVLAHGGAIEVRSTERGGTLFEVRLPRRVPDP
jgi:PAS domain S-box-containing protein